MAHEYDPIAAAAVAHAQLPAPMRATLSVDDVLYVLELEFRYQQRIGLTSDGPQSNAVPPAIDLEQMVIAMIEQARQQGRSFSPHQIAHILRGEDVYLRQIGVLE